MYHCHISFYFTGSQRDIFETVREMPPLEHFTHSFTESERPEAALLAPADVILADIRSMDAEAALLSLTGGMKPGAELIVLSGREQLSALSDGASAVKDIWVMPMGEEEVRFRFLRWQQGYKLARDCWQAQQFLDATLLCTPNAIWYKTKDGIHEKVNASFCRMLNKTREQVQGQRHAYIWDVEEDDPVCIESELEVMRSRETRKSEELVHTHDGEMLLTTYKSPLFDCDGSVMGTVGVGVNMTRERAYEREILEKNRTLEMLFSSLDCGIVCHSLDGTRIISVNEAALKLLDYGSMEEMLEAGFFQVAQSVLDEDKPKLRECITSLKNAGESIGVEYRVKQRSGKLLHILGNIKLLEKDGELFYQRFLLDCTAQRQREEQMRNQKDQEVHYQEQMLELFSALLSDNIDDIYMMMDGAGINVEFVSPNIERVLGVSARDILNSADVIGHAEYITGYEVGSKGLAALEPGMALEPMETRRVHQKTGEEKWFRESVYCVSVQGVKKIVVYISDRTREREDRNVLTEALEIAQVANRTKTAFLSSVSHDIRTPMNAIMGLVTLLKDDADNPERVVEYTQKISAASQHLMGLINDVLDMNKLESGSAVLNITPLNLAEVIEEINSIIRPQARMKEQEFEISATSLTNELLLGDKLRITQILVNILSNAVKYTPNGGRFSLNVQELSQVDRNYSRIRFTISDNGQGMSEEYQKVIFEPFTREQDMAWNTMQGSGLGMAITKSLVDLMGGTIRVESALGEGSTFTVELELRIQKTEDDPGFWANHGMERILVADDDVDVCRDIGRKMADTGVKIQFASNGAQAIEMVRRAREDGRPYDLILLDWKMPDLDGLATARLVRKNASDEIPILLLTSYDWTEIEKEALEVGISDFLPKPFFMSNFKDAVGRTMDTHKKEAPAVTESVFSSKHVLLVDDIDVNRIIMVKILTTLGAKCDEAVNGQEALEKFEASRPGEYDMILMDIQMPIMNGYDATRAIRASSHPSAGDIPIIAMSANAFVDDVRESLESGMDAHISKPVVIGHMEQTVREVLNRRNKQAQ
ncbi:MAG: response regulator [Butyricicoccus sp.]|nr:response regulator [Butyricicoccus sp.]MCM1232975.1 response regulator [Ruminococcus flavefaciens]